MLVSTRGLESLMTMFSPWLSGLPNTSNGFDYLNSPHNDSFDEMGHASLNFQDFT